MSINNKSKTILYLDETEKEERRKKLKIESEANTKLRDMFDDYEDSIPEGSDRLSYDEFHIQNKTELYKIEIKKDEEGFDIFPKQKMCFENARYKNHKFFFCVDKISKKPEGEKEFGSCKDIATFLDVYNSLLPEDKVFYESLVADKPRYEYYDIDMKEAPEGITPNKVFVNFNSIRMKFILNELGFSNYSETDWRVTCSSRLLENGRWKISLHLVNRKRIWKDGKQTKRWYNLFTEYVKSNYGIEDLFDSSVKSDNRAMRIIGSTKLGQNRPLQPFKGFEKYPIEDFFITNVNILNYSNDFQEFIDSKDKKELEYKAVDKKRIDFQSTMEAVTFLDIENNETESLIELITEKIEQGKHILCDGTNPNMTYARFRDLCFAYIHSAQDQTKENQMNFIKNEIFPYYRHCKDYEVANIVKSLVGTDYSGVKITEKSLHYWAKYNERYKELFAPKQYFATGVFDTYDKFTWGEFKDEMECKVFSTFEDIRKCFISHFNRVCVPMKWDCDTFFIKVEDQMNDFIFKEAKRKIDFEVRYEEKSSKGLIEEKKVKFKELYAKCIDNIKRFNNFGFIPYGIRDSISDSKISKTCFNQFSGFRAKYIGDLKNIKCIEPVLNHIKVVWANNDEFTFNYIMSWFASIIQKPSEKTKVMLVLYSAEQQIGKGIIVEWMIEHIFGFRHGLKTGSMKTVVGNFNGACENKIIVAMDEVNADEKYSDKEYEKMKTLITDKAQQIEKKGIDSYQTMDCTNYITMTNNQNALKIGDNDARTAVLKCNPIYAGNRSYFESLNKELKKQEVIDNFYTYLCDMKNLVELKNIPKTDVRDEMILQTSEQPIKYFKCIEMGDYKPKFDIVENVSENKILTTGKDIYDDFLNWVVEFNEKQGIYSQLKFSKFIVTRFGNSRTIWCSKEKKAKKLYDITGFVPSDEEMKKRCL